MTRCIRLTLLVLAFLALGRAGFAHDPNAPPRAQLSIQAQGSDIVASVRVPADALEEANLPRDADGRFATRGLDEALAVVANGVARALEPRAGDAVLPILRVSGRSAPDRASAEFHIIYSRDDISGPLSIRLQAFRAGGARIATVVSYTPATGRPRSFETRADHERIVFEPGVNQVAREFAARGSDALLGARLVLLFIVCLLAPSRPPRQLASMIGTFVAGLAVIFAATTASHGLSDQAVIVSQIVAGSALVVLAGQNLLSATSRWTLATCAACGMAVGTGLGRSVHDVAALAGAHETVAFLAFGVVVIIGTVWLAALLVAAAGLLYRWGVAERWAKLLLAAIVAHSALHEVDTLAQQLRDRGGQPDHLFLILALAWTAALILAGAIGQVARGGHAEGSADTLGLGNHTWETGIR
jgi:hypothetical protein